MNKDTDLMRDTGGSFRHKELQKPSRKDRKKPKMDESDPDFNDTKRDPDLKTSSVKVARELVRLARELVAFSPYDRRFYELFEGNLNKISDRLGGHGVNDIVADVEAWARRVDTDRIRREGDTRMRNEIDQIFQKHYPESAPLIIKAFADAWSRYCNVNGGIWQ